MAKYKPTPLSPIERQQLAALTYHEGFRVLQRLMEVRVQTATVAILGVDPTDEHRQQKISDLQAQAYARNSFCAELLDDINWQLQQEIAEQESQIEDNYDPGQQAVINAALKMGIFTPKQ